MCEPETLMGSQVGVLPARDSTVSAQSRTAASIGRNWVPRAMYSLIGSFWIWTRKESGETPRFSARASSEAGRTGAMRWAGGERRRAGQPDVPLVAPPAPVEVLLGVDRLHLDSAGGLEHAHRPSRLRAVGRARPRTAATPR